MADLDPKIKLYEEPGGERSPDPRGSISGNEEWLREQEESVSSYLRDNIRRTIAIAMTVEDSPIKALEDVRARYFEGNEDSSDVQTINRIIAHTNNLAPIPAAAEVEEQESIVEKPEEGNAEAFRKKIKDSLTKSVTEASEGDEFNISEGIRKAAAQIDDIFEQVEDGYQTGFIPDVEELQVEVDRLVREFGFDEEVFSGAVVKYDSLFELPEEMTEES